MEQSVVRPPIVVVVGHVDHGKTSLLDFIRNTAVTKREAGGITQSIGASVATTKDNKQITFIDTPGHALFGAMRQRGIGMADIAILVVASDDGVQPQTKEAITLLQTSQIPFVVALTKIDLPTANIEMALQSLEKEGVYLEKRGGDISYVGISSKTGEGITELLDLISLLSEVHGIKGSSTDQLEAFVIETSKDKRGQLVSVILKSGTIKVGDTIFAGILETKVKGLFDDTQKPIKEITAGFPAQVLGFTDLPSVAVKVANAPTQDIVKKVAQTTSVGSLKIFLKAKTVGSLEAIVSNLPKDVEVVGSGVGDVIESDIFFAKAANTPIFLFEAKYSAQMKKLSEMEGVKIEKFDVVYDLIETLKELLIKDKEEIKGSAQIVAIFPFNNKKIAGSKILKGQFKKGQTIKVTRKDQEIGKAKVFSIRKQKDEVAEVGQGEECGIYFEPQLAFAVGDVLLSVA